MTSFIIIIMYLFRRVKLIITNKCYCYNCLAEPVAGFTQDGIDLCFTCYDVFEAYKYFPTYLNNRLWRLLHNSTGMCKYIKSQISHIHEWELDFNDYNYGQYSEEYYICIRCCGVRSLNSHTRWQWNPFVKWH